MIIMFAKRERKLIFRYSMAEMLSKADLFMKVGKFYDSEHKITFFNRLLSRSRRYGTHSKQIISHSEWRCGAETNMIGVCS